MPRAPLPIGSYGKISSSKNAPGRYRATARFRDHDGKTRQVEAWGKTGAEAETELRTKLAARADVTDVEITPHSRVSALLAAYERDLVSRVAEGDLSQQSADVYLSTLRLHVTPALTDLTVREVTTRKVNLVLADISQRTPGQTKRVKAIMNAIMAIAVDAGAAPANPVIGAGRGKRRAKPQPKALTLPQLDAMRIGLQAWLVEPGVRGPRRDASIADINDLLLATGLRIGEVLAVRWQDLDLAAAPATLTVSGTIISIKGEGISRKPKPKTEAGWRVLALPKFATDTLLRLQVAATPNPHDVVFASRKGTLRSPHNVRRTWRDAREEIGFDWVTPHTFRKTVATLIDSQVDLKTAAAQLGHSGTGVTAKHYVAKAAQAPDSSDVLQALAPSTAASRESTPQT